MTLIAGLKCGDAVVLASDSQVTVDGMKTRGAKLFASPHGFIWGVAGPVAAAQAIDFQLGQVITGSNPDGHDGRLALREVMKCAADEMRGPDGSLSGGRFGGLFAWHSAGEHKNHLLKAYSDGTVEFLPEYGSVGSSSELTRFALFGFNSSGFLEYGTLPVEAAMMLVHKVTDDTVLATASGVDGPIQLAVVDETGGSVLAEEDLKPVRDTASAFRMHQADFLKRVEVPVHLEEKEVRGLVPDADE
jgi:20S proteasome alpha/beta subunit